MNHTTFIPYLILVFIYKKNKKLSISWYYESNLVRAIVNINELLNFKGICQKKKRPKGKIKERTHGQLTFT